jgi:phage terminase large subunit-like protein
MTRWHERDLAGELLDAEPDVWTHTNVPAVAGTGIPDALGRMPGTVMTSALGYTADHFAAARRTSGERAWFALYEGIPSAPEGGLVKREWLDDWRLPTAPLGPIKTVVGVDPSDSGSGDSCGIVAASLTGEGIVAAIADQSAPMTSDQWARTAVDLAVDVGASEIAVEGFAARETYQRVVMNALRRAKLKRPITVTTWPPKGSGRGGGDAIARSAGLLQGLETGTTRIAGHLPDLEGAAVNWQSGQHQPDSLAALVVAHDVLVHSVGHRVHIVSPLDVERRAREGKLPPPPAWMRRRICDR